MIISFMGMALIVGFLIGAVFSALWMSAATQQINIYLASIDAPSAEQIEPVSRENVVSLGGYRRGMIVDKRV